MSSLTPLPMKTSSADAVIAAALLLMTTARGP